MVSRDILEPSQGDRGKSFEVNRIPINVASGNLAAVLAISRNVDGEGEGDRETSEYCLSEYWSNKDRFALAMRGANDGLWDWNMETDEVYFSPRWKSMLGYEDHEISNYFQSWANLVHHEDKAFVLGKVEDYINGKDSTYEVEMRMRHREGHLIYVLSRAFLVHRSSDGKPLRLVGTHVDITARKKTEMFTRRNAEILKMIATGQPASVIYNEIALMYEERNPGMRCSMLELEDGKLLHGGAPSLPKAYCDAVHGLENGPEVGSCGASTYTGKRVLVENIATDPKWADIKQLALPHGMQCCWSDPIKSSAGEVLGAFGMYYNHPALPNQEELNDLTSAAQLASIVMERDQAQKQIRKLAYTDTLTGLASRVNLYQTVENLIEGSEFQGSRVKRSRFKQSELGRDPYYFSLFYLDLDDFKGVNDSLGHDVGDLLLIEIAKRLRGGCRHQDFVARLSGDEFCILIRSAPHNDDIKGEVEAIAQRCLRAIAQPIELCGRTITPACSIGIAHYPQDGQDLATLLKAADTSLYSAKEQGKNRYAFYEPVLSQRAEYRFQVEQYLRGAIEQGELSLVYQPQVQLDTGKIIGVEALSRWHHPKLGTVSPEDFIATAEKIGVIKPFTEWVLKTACNQAMVWRNAGVFDNVNLAVNISPQHFLDDEFVPFIQRILDETGMDASALKLEMTESVVQTDERNLGTFNRLKQLGTLLAIDDFGIGYSSFASLKHLNVDYLKLDKYFIDDMVVDRKSQVLIQSMIEMGHNLNYELIAEGVETFEQCGMLKEMGCKIAQGYLFSKPVSAEKTSRLLAESASRNQSMWLRSDAA